MDDSTVYDELAPDEAQLRAALAALALPVPAEIEHEDEGERKAALAAHLLRAASRATHNLTNATADFGEAARRASCVLPQRWPIEEDHWTTARIELAFTAGRMEPLLDDHSAGAVTMDDPDAEPDECGGTEQVEAHAAGAWAAIEAAGVLIDLRQKEADPQLTEAILDLAGDRIDWLIGAFQALARHHGYRVDATGRESG
jgi:hypothetical protein